MKRIRYQISLELDSQKINLTISPLFGRVVNSVFYQFDKSFVLDELDFGLNGEGLRVKYVPALEIMVRPLSQAITITVSSENKDAVDRVARSIVEHIAKRVKQG